MISAAGTQLADRPFAYPNSGPTMARSRKSVPARHKIRTSLQGHQQQDHKTQHHRQGHHQLQYQHAFRSLENFTSQGTTRIAILPSVCSIPPLTNVSACHDVKRPVDRRDAMLGGSVLNKWVDITSANFVAVAADAPFLELLPHCLEIEQRMSQRRKPGAGLRRPGSGCSAESARCAHDLAIKDIELRHSCIVAMSLLD